MPTSTSAAVTTTPCSLDRHVGPFASAPRETADWLFAQAEWLTCLTCRSTLTRETVERTRRHVAVEGAS